MARKNGYEDMRNEDFDRLLLEILHEDGPEMMLEVPGVYEALAEHYNNEVLDRWTREREESEVES